MATLQEERKMRELAKYLEKKLANMYRMKMGFFIVCAPFSAEDAVEGEDLGIADFIGNSAREVNIKWLRETADRLEGRDTIPIKDTTLRVVKDDG